jgi:hypothetical protein
MVVCLDVIVQLLPEITKHFPTLRPLVLLRQTCRTIADETRDNLQVYRSILANMHLMNKDTGGRRFVLSKYDVQGLEFTRSDRFSWWDRQRYRLRNGHLVSPLVFFNEAVLKHKSVSGIAKAFTKRKTRACMWLFHKYLKQCVIETAPSIR